MQERAEDEILAAARRGFIDNGGVPDGLISEPILRSWQRCVAQGLDMTRPSPHEPMDGSALRDLQERNDRLRALSRPELAGLRAEAKLTDSIVILTDPSGLVLDTAGAAEFADQASRVALRPGVAWSEASTGTNAIGTALVERRPIEVLGAEHFFEPNRMLSCAASPIFDPQGRLAGVLDMSNHASIRHLHALGLVRLAAEQIEHRFFAHGFEHCRLVRFHRAEDYLGTAREAVLVFDGDTLVAGNRRALRLLGLDWRAIGSKSLPDLFVELHEGGDRQRLRTRAGEAFFGEITEPRAGKPAARPVAARIAAGDIEPVYEPEVRDQLARGVRLVDADIPLLIQGETGTGKEVFARHLHALSSRSKKPLVAVNCAALPEALIEAELFGYEEGAFTGATRGGRKGLLEQAAGGVLFLDEIGDMPLTLQSRLLRVLQDKGVTPLGAGKVRTIDFALICATHQPLKQLIDSGRFRADLYFRIAQYKIELEPVRASADPAAVISAIWTRLGGDAAGIPLSPEALDTLARYRWPGNFRQLVGTLRAALALAPPGRPLAVSDLPGDLADDGEAGPAAIRTLSSDATLRDVTEATMLAALAAADGNVSRAARQLGVDRSTFYRRIIRPTKLQG
ncbi:MAG: sigma-54-dependent Fis family transcriptional regulator [Devosia nanyangense]|uniref:Sigma-54-dependent Fis family transcriptional regulator n=1 Tax=Devosia nanyangense TaxID=1228055 RepID=A0A933NYV6_9HYPH|nr:sigma-54-dependent Fis family transcriptional regulator [Devosia nanyangense]